jgi:hypothetical protein
LKIRVTGLMVVSVNIHMGCNTVQLGTDISEEPAVSIFRIAVPDHMASSPHLYLEDGGSSFTLERLPDYTPSNPRRL